MQQPEKFLFRGGEEHPSDGVWLLVVWSAGGGLEVAVDVGEVAYGRGCRWQWLLRRFMAGAVGGGSGWW